VKTDVFKRQMWYAYEGEMGLIALDPNRVREIIQLNKEGKKPKELLEYVEVVAKEPDYSNVVGQDSLNRFEHAFKKKKKPVKKQQNTQGQRPQQAQDTAVKAEKPQQQGERKFNKKRKPNRNRGNQPNKEGNA
jgi:hypothetical protein